VRFRRIAPAVVLAVAAAGLTAVQSGPAHAATVTGLPITSVYQVLADTAHGHVFISQGPDAGADAPIVVTSLSGTQVATIGKGARGLALSADDKTLYAAIGDTITAFSTTTLKQTAVYPTPGLAWQVAVQSGRLWVSYQDGQLGEIGGIDLADPSAPWDSVPAQWTGFPPAIAADPSDSGVLVAAAQPPSVGPAMATFNVKDPSAVALIDSSTSTSCGYNYPSVLPGGATFLCGGFSYSTATLAPDPSDAAYPGFTVVAPNGAVASGNNAEILAYPAGAVVPTASYDEFYGLPLPASFSVSYSSPVGLAWAADSEQLFAVIESVSDSSSHVYSLLSLYPFERVPAPLTLTSTATTIGYDGSFTVTPHLGVTDGNRAYSVYRTIAGHPRQLVYSCPCDPSGSFTTTGSSWTTNTTYTAVFTGDARYEPATVNLAVKVGVKVSAALSGYYQSIWISVTQYRVYHHTATLKDAVAITPDKAGECVKLQIQKYAANAWRAYTMTGCGTVSKSGKVTVSSKLGPTGRFRVQADFRASAKDTTNVSTNGGWLYYEVTK
jgi:hypothetical protein